MYDIIKCCLFFFSFYWRWRQTSDHACKSTVAQGMLERRVKDKRYVAEQFQLMESSSMVETQEAGSEGDDDADAADVFAPVSWLWYFISGD